MPQPLTSKTLIGNERLRPLVLDEEAHADIRRVRDHAENPRNIYRPPMPPPGDHPAHVCRINTYRICFSITEMDGKQWRHLSVSVPGKLYANVGVMLLLAQEFGFPGWDGKDISKLPQGWMGNINKEEHCVVLVCPYNP